jgi:predicted secreted Zn-dependent protease
MPFPAALLILALLAPPSALGEPMIRVHTSYYYLDGGSAAVLAGQIDQSGPVGPDGEHHPAKTKWDVQWKFKREQLGVNCSMGEVAVAVGIAQTLPKWRGESKARSALRTHWEKFFAALKRHEERHKDRGIIAGREIEAAIRAVKPASNCEALDAAANTAAEEILDKHRKLDEEYDRKTGYGRTEGATLL